MRWVGPITVDRLLDWGSDSSIPPPPLEPSVYIVSRLAWHNEPSVDCTPLYSGGLTSDSPRFRARIGDLIADMFGFFGEVGKKGHHSGGQAIFRYCIENSVSPRHLYLGWAEDVSCHRCEENRLYTKLSPELNRKRPPPCPIHRSV